MTATDRTGDRIETCISFLSGKAAQTVAKFSRDRLSAWNMTPIQFAVLQAVLQKPDQSASELGAFLVIDSATITGVIDRLCKTGALVRKADSRDRRITRIGLTPQGRRQIVAAQAAMRSINAEIAAAFGDDADTLWRLLERLAAFEPAPDRRPKIRQHA